MLQHSSLLNRHPCHQAYVPGKVHPLMVLLGVFLLLVLSIGGVLFYRFSHQPKNNFQFTATVVTKPVETQTIPIAYETVGTLEASQQVDIKPETPGVIRQIAVQEGQFVRQGQLLLTLDADKQTAEIAERQSGIGENEAALLSLQSDYQAKQESVRVAEAQRNWAQSEYNRYKTLWEKEFVSAQDLEQRKTQWDVAQANLSLAMQQRDSANAKLRQAEAAIGSAQARYARAVLSRRDTRIRAPFSGQVGPKLVSIGDYVIPTQKLVTVVQPNPIKIAISLPERYLGYLRLGLPVELQTEHLPDKRFVGTVSFINPVTATDTRTVLIKATVPNDTHQLLPGQYAKVKLILGQKQHALVVPEESLIPQGERFFMYVVQDGKAHFRPVEIGDRLPGWVEIVRGVSLGDRVITGGIQKAQDGLPVREAGAQPAAQAGTRTNAKGVF